MNIKTRIKEKGIDAIIVLFIFLTAGIYSCAAQGQSFRPFKYMGFEGTFGARSFKINSSITQLNQMAVLGQGGTLGLVFGNDILRTKVRAAGFYYSSSSTPRTIDLFESEALLNFYPLEYFRRYENALDIYLIGGVGIDNIKFYGHYLSEDTQKVNYSTNDEPYLGKLSQINLTGGLGLEYQLTINDDFVHLFAEAKYGRALHSSADRVAFENTSIKDFSSINIGVSFGICR